MPDRGPSILRRRRSGPAEGASPDVRISDVRGPAVVARPEGAPARDEEELFLDDGEPIFVSHHRSAGTTFAVLAPPLFEEHARTRKVIVNLARELAATGIDAVRFDYPGTGLSEGATDQLTLSCAFDAL